MKSKRDFFFYTTDFFFSIGIKHIKKDNVFNMRTKLQTEFDFQFFFKLVRKIHIFVKLSFVTRLFKIFVMPEMLLN